MPNKSFQLKSEKCLGVKHITNWVKLASQIGAALFYYKLGQTLLQIGEASLLQIGLSVITNWDSNYKLAQPLLQNRAAVTN